MDFKNLVLGDAEEKYREMLGGKTPSPISSSVKVASSDEYVKRRGKYRQRLESERKSFNDAISTVRGRRDSRLGYESRMRETKAMDKQRLRSTLIIFAIFLAVAVSLVLIPLTDSLVYMTDEVIPAFGFEGFGYMFDEGFEDFGYLIDSGFSDVDPWSLSVFITVILTAIVYIGLLIVGFVNKDDFGWLIGLLLGGMLLSGLPLVIILLAVRLILALLSLLLLLLVLPIGVPIVCVAGIVVLFIKSKEFALNRTRTFTFLFTAVLIVVALLGFIISSNYITFSNIGEFISMLISSPEQGGETTPEGGDGNSSTAPGEQPGDENGASDHDLEAMLPDDPFMLNNIAMHLSLGNHATTSLDPSSTYRVIAFTPDSNGEYSFAINSDASIKVTFFITAGSALAVNPDFPVEDGKHFIEVDSKTDFYHDLRGDFYTGCTFYALITVANPGESASISALVQNITTS